MKPRVPSSVFHGSEALGSASGSMDAANLLKPALARGAIRVNGATTIREYRQTIEKDGALERRFQAVRVKEPSADEAVAILLALRPRLEAHHGVALDEAALRAAVEWSIRYLPDFRLPDKALDLVDQACAAVRFATLSPGKGRDRLSLSRAGTGCPGHFVVGRDEIAAAVAENLFHDERRLIRFDMSEFMEEHSVAKLIGSPPGYVGHDAGGQLTDAIRTHPYSVVLFDEIEKANPRVLDLFLQIFDEGTLTDAQGRKCDFRESVIILTSNLGSGGGPVKRFMGFASGDPAEDPAGDANKKRAEEAIRKQLRPELVNRLTKVVHFEPLGMERAREILGKPMAGFNKRLVDRGVTVELDQSAKELILREGYSVDFGARNLERVVDQRLGVLIVEGLLNGKITYGQTIRLEAHGGRIELFKAWSA